MPRYVRTSKYFCNCLEYNGVIAATKEVMDRFSKGDVLTSKDEYFNSTPRFTTASKKYDWLNKVQAVAKMVTVQQKQLKYDLFVVR